MISAMVKLFTFPIVALLLGLVVTGQIPEAPVPNRLVVDYGNVLTAEEENRLTNKLNAFADTTSNQILVLTIESLNGMDAGSFATEVGHQWGIGNKGFDNGIVVLVAPNDRKTFIATGYGTEEFIPDAVAHRIVNRHLLPAFRANDYYGGIMNATDEIMARMSGRYIVDDQEGIPITFIVVLIIFILIVIWISRSGRNGRKTYTGRKVIRFPRPYSHGKSGGYWGEFSKGSGHFGGSSSSGGFGGFGGGGFGGGGAGGSW